MVLLYTPKTQLQTSTQSKIVDILDLDYQGLGVAKIQGKTWFIENALPGEKVKFKITQEKRQFGLGVTQHILKESSDRQKPTCSYYHICGGCQSQHIPIQLQRQSKQDALFKRLSKLQSEKIEFQPMIIGKSVGYRRRVRLSMLFNSKSKQIEIGLRQKASDKIVAIQQCDVLEPILNNLLPKLTALFSQFSQPQQLGHIELVAADNGVAMLLRYRENLRKSDRTLLLNFAHQENLMLFLQDDKCIENISNQFPYYELENNLKLQFDIRDFIQVNTYLNQQMIKTAVDWLDLNEQDHVLDLFCGMGNFTLSISQRVNNVVGIEGVSAMVEKAKANAERNDCKNVKFYRANLDQSFAEQTWANETFNKVLLDPPRSGAAFALTALCQLQADKILYVSCNPATLVRDAEILIKSNYKINKVAMIDMFPHTGHLESITLFEK
ncbi:23S rRNA (uracil(1939)-C(5))-methyltransferase RlmD [Pasteurella bettyae]|uniref:23S rRNA (uracil(1939)-C(5))-methyltransferase RlmD n=1 Tax=Pasteurella bettyae CCUG 2042 TaxID=1095749 RepID=I3DJA6_9PAST|nr:23S rRNA (uracil(1939)-C(5))-methyltransferase RlmD [Pasteurella bettyae]EIJ71799.1 23S rRNA (uracil-5-)-methyltransferase RumA [Pasteurella bettyae CCUG 2042]SUB22405.1 23S rRNA (uracil-5-)-methyltransferase RumA [Pasteurella bettyae]